jgi:hypothetical protein
MYDMYPQSWASDDVPLGPVVQRPRRRVRKEHSVLPPVIARHVEAVETRRLAG